MDQALPFNHRWTYLLIPILGLITLWWLLVAPVGFPLDQPVTISRGAGVTGISQELARAGVVQSPLFFQLAVRLAGVGSQLQAGEYWFEQRLNMLEVLRRVKSGRFITNPVKLTIPEGLSPGQVASLVSNKFPQISPIELTELLTEQPELAFPDTYFFPMRAGVAEITAAWQSHWERQTAELRAASSTLSWPETVVLASIVEEEVSDPRDRRLVAGVLLKRLEIDMPLQVDVAPETYERYGLPLAAISNVSLDALEAVVYPTASDYWYYLSDPTGVTHYARSFEEHKQNRQKYLD